MTPRTRPPHRSGSTTKAAGPGPGPNLGVGPRAGDDLLNRRMADALRLEAEAREARSLTTSTEDARANARLRASLMALIEGGEA
jgi:hypothetical protein